MDDNEEFKELLQKSRFEIVQRLQLDRPSLFDYLRSKNVFDTCDCELVLIEKTREQKASKFLDILETKGKDGFTSFLDVLQLINQGLYESITGKKANPCRIWENMRDRFALGNCSSVPDVELLSGQLKRTIDDLQDMALRNQQLLKENQDLGMKLDQASTDLDLKHRRVEVLKKHMTDAERGVLEAHSNANKLSDAVAKQLRALQQGIFERNTYIIALQMKLLATEEEIKESRKTQEELRTHNELLSSKWQDLSRDYDYERRESMKLSAKLKSQQGNLQKVGEFERKCREFKEVNQKMMAERDESMLELEGLKDLTEALKARYDLLVEECKEFQESFVSETAEHCKLKEEIEELKLQLSLSKIGMSDLKGWNEDLEETVKQYREQRDCFAASRKAALLERDKIRNERDEAVQYYTELLQERDEMIKKQCDHSKHFEEKHEKACTELKALRERIIDAEHKIEELKVQRRSEENYESKTNEAINVSNNQEQKLDSEDCSPTSPKRTLDHVLFSELTGFPWKGRRGAKELMQSLRKRVTGEHHKTLSLDRSIDVLKVDGCGTLSEEARKSLTLRHGKLLFKTPPTYNTLRAMFGLSVGGHMGSISDDMRGLGTSGACGSSPKDSSEDTYTTTSSSNDDLLRDDHPSEFEKGAELDAESDDTTCNMPNDRDASPERAQELHALRFHTKSLSEPDLSVSYKSVDASVSCKERDKQGKDKLGNNEDGNEELDESDGTDFHWVSKDECLPTREGVNDELVLMNCKKSLSESKSKEEIEEIFKTLSRGRPPFRQRAWAMKKKKGLRSSSFPYVALPHDEIITPNNEPTDR